MGSIISEAEDALGSVVSEGVIPGKAMSSPKARKGAPYQNVEVKYFVAALSDAGDRNMIEHIMTSGLRCGGELLYPGDIVVVGDEKSTFTKEGEAIVMIKYLMIPLDTPVSPA